MNAVDRGDNVLETVSRLVDTAWVEAYESDAADIRRRIGHAVHALESLDFSADLDDVDLESVDIHLKIAAELASDQDIIHPIREARQLLETSLRQLRQDTLETDGGDHGASDQAVRGAIRNAEREGDRSE